MKSARLMFLLYSVISTDIPTASDYDGVGVEFDGPKKLLWKEGGVFKGMVTRLSLSFLWDLSQVF